MYNIVFNSLPGHYIYTESSPPRKANDTARLISAVIKPTRRSACFSFHYVMRGSTIGTLNVYSSTNQMATLMWTLSGMQGNTWTYGSVPLPRSTRTQNSQVSDQCTYSTMGCMLGCNISRQSKG